tara:strand:- start:378 stop:806 length:429 start_codon:yes stop_codon:yes gene_type:complete
MKYNVIFICTGNSCRSQIAEGLLKEKARNKFNVYSAGSNPSRIHPAAVSVMEEWGIDISHQKSEHLDAYVNRDIHIVITVCDNANQSCPVFSDGEIKIHWSIKDPFNGWSNDQKKLQPYRSARDDLKNRIEDFLASNTLNQM